MIPTRVCLTRDLVRSSTLFALAPRRANVTLFPDHGFPGSSFVPTTASRDLFERRKGFLGDRCSRMRVSLSHHRIKELHITLSIRSMRTRPTRTVILFSIHKKNHHRLSRQTFCLVLPYQMFLRIPLVNHISRIVYPLLEPRYS